MRRRAGRQSLRPRLPAVGGQESNVRTVLARVLLARYAPVKCERRLVEVEAL